MVAVLVVMVVTLVPTVWTATARGRQDLENTSVLFRGSCRGAEAVVMGAHLAINVLSTLLLGASNYCMQIVSAPTRRDIDRMHAKGRVLDVGINSAWNVLAFDVRRKVIWVLLLLNSTPMHLM